MDTNKKVDIKVLIIEDEPFAQNELKRLLSNSSYTSIVLDCIDSIEDALIWFDENEHPDLVFLDIQLSDGLSFEIFEKTKILSPIIFTTAFDEYAIQAFKVNSIDYLLKPIEPDALEIALEKFAELKDHYSSKQTNISEAQIAHLLEFTKPKEEFKSRFLIKIGDQIKYIFVENIAYFFAEDNVVFLVAENAEKYIIDYSLNQLTNYLNPGSFFRLNRSYFVNIKSIHKIHKFFNSRLKVELKPATDEDLLISRVKVPDFLKWVES